MDTREGLQGVVKVKPLVWVQPRPREKTLIAKSLVGDWCAWEMDGVGYLSRPNRRAGYAVVGDLSIAQAIAQAEYSAIISAELVANAPVTVQDAVKLQEVAALIDGWYSLISEAEAQEAEDAEYHSDGSERPDLWDYSVFVDLDTAKATLAALRAIAEGRA